MALCKLETMLKGERLQFQNRRKMARLFVMLQTRNTWHTDVMQTDIDSAALHVDQLVDHRLLQGAMVPPTSMSCPSMRALLK